MEYHDPFVPALPKLGLASVPLDAETLGDVDVVVVVTAHTGIDWEMVADSASWSWTCATSSRARTARSGGSDEPATARGSRSAWSA